MDVPGEGYRDADFHQLGRVQVEGGVRAAAYDLDAHLELAQNREVVLAQGLVVEDRGVSVDDARLLMMTVQKFYGAIEAEEAGEKRRRMLEMFSNGEEGFNVQELMEEVEKAV